MERLDSMKQYKVQNLAEDERKKGRYLMDYSRKYQDPYDVVEKARKHVIIRKKRNVAEDDLKKS